MNYMVPKAGCNSAGSFNHPAIDPVGKVSDVDSRLF